jgi:hypothetical protein
MFLQSQPSDACARVTEEAAFGQYCTTDAGTTESHLLETIRRT